MAVAGALILLWIPLGLPRVGPFSDSIEYIILAQQLRELWTGGDTTVLMHTRLPVGFSAWLALGAVDALHPGRAFWMNWLATSWALLTFAAWIARVVSGRSAVAVMALTAALPGLFILSLNPISESLFAALLATLLALVHSPRQWLRGLALFSAALLPLVRTLGLPLIAALVAWRLWRWWRAGRRNPWREAATSLAILFPGIAWHGWRSTLKISNSYSTSLDLEQLRQRFGSIPEFLGIQSLALPEGVARLLDPTPGAITWIFAWLLLLIAAVGWWRRWREGALDAWLLPPALGIAQIWPWPNEYPRMLLPVIPVLLVCAWQGSTELRRIWPRARRAPEVFAALLVALMAFVWLPMLSRMSLPLPVSERPEMRQAAYLLAATPQDAAAIAAASAGLQRAIAQLAQTIGPRDCVYSMAAEAVWINSGGRVVARHLDPAIDPARALPPQMSKCRYILAAQFTTPQYPKLPALFPLDAIGDWGEVLWQVDYVAGNRRIPAAALIQHRDWPVDSAPDALATPGAAK